MIEIKKIIRKFSIFHPKKSQFAQIQTRILTRPQLSSTFCKLHMIKHLLSFNLSYSKLLGAYCPGNDYVITKKIRQKRKFCGQKIFFQKFQIMFSNHLSSSSTPTKRNWKSQAFSENPIFGTRIPRHMVREVLRTNIILAIWFNLYGINYTPTGP